MKRAIAIACIAVFCSATLAQGPGPGTGAAGKGKGQGWQFNSGNTYGWSLMSPEERTAHRDKMLAAKTYDECKAYQDAQHKLMVERAKEKGQAIPAAPRQNMCDRMKQAGRLN